jgi:uncharacterized protein YbaR (Trm112 family)
MNDGLHPPVGSYLCCPACGSMFESAVPSAFMGKRERKFLQCQEQGHRFPLHRGVPDLLAPQYADMLAAVKNGGASRGATTAQVLLATDWLSEVLQLKVDPRLATRSDKALRRLLARLAVLIEEADAKSYSMADIREVCSILASEAMSSGYRRHVADPAVASLEAVNYEKYEDILLRNVVTGCLATSNEVALIELGSGPGRLLHQYGSTISQRRDACEVYRRLGPQLYRPASLPDGDRLQLVLGVDFASDMLQSAARWLKHDKLDDLISRGTIAQLRATVRDLPVSFQHGDWNDTTRVACILFQTLGNQIGREAQLEMLKVARDLVGPRGVVFVSVFNASAFPSEGQSYYESIRGSVGAPWYWGDRSFLSKRGVYSKWFFPDELRSLFHDADMADAVILDDGALKVFPRFGGYINLKSQERYKRRALVGIFARGVEATVTG